MTPEYLQRTPAGPLAGIKVVELASWMFVPSAGTVLVDWGADVIKVEHPVTGDPQHLGAAARRRQRGQLHDGAAQPR
jgi:crotonobetainyl-CoA:carnitine CoA-transferase CaiB-like acyl-CoA transferase